MRFLLFASYLPSVINFRSELINLLQVHSSEVHVVAPKIPSHILIRNQLSEMGIIVHEITLSRTRINPIKDTYSLLLLFNLILRIRPKYILSYTIKPVIYGIVMHIMHTVDMIISPTRVVVWGPTPTHPLTI